MSDDQSNKKTGKELVLKKIAKASTIFSDVSDSICDVVKIAIPSTNNVETCIESLPDNSWAGFFCNGFSHASTFFKTWTFIANGYNAFHYFNEYREFNKPKDKEKCILGAIKLALDLAKLGFIIFNGKVPPQCKLTLIVVKLLLLPIEIYGINNIPSSISMTIDFGKAFLYLPIAAGKEVARAFRRETNNYEFLNHFVAPKMS